MPQPVIRQDGNIAIYHDQLNLEQRREDVFYRSNGSMCSVQEIGKQILWKAKSLWTLDEIIKKYNLSFSGKVLELGGGYGVQAVFLKNKFGNEIDFYYSDISLHAVQTSSVFEKSFDTTIDHKWVIEAENIPADKDFFDLVFFFESFHHTQDPAKAVAECWRVLKPGGKLYLIMEPACPTFWRYLYHRKTHRHEVEEKSYSRATYKKLILKNFSSISQHNFTGFFNRESKKALLYYLIMSLLPNQLHSLFPCSQVIVAIK